MSIIKPKKLGGAKKCLYECKFIHKVVTYAKAPPIEAAPVDGISRAMWGHLPVAELKVLASVRTTEALPELQQRRSGSPMLIALILALLLAGLILGLSLLR